MWCKYRIFVQENMAPTHQEEELLVTSQHLKLKLMWKATIHRQVVFIIMRGWFYLWAVLSFTPEVH